MVVLKRLKWQNFKEHEFVLIIEVGTDFFFYDNIVD